MRAVRHLPRTVDVISPAVSLTTRNGVYSLAELLGVIAVLWVGLGSWRRGRWRQYRSREIWDVNKRESPRVSLYKSRLLQHCTEKEISAWLLSLIRLFSAHEMYAKHAS